jgi:hypothetical protein
LSKGHVIPLLKPAALALGLLALSTLSARAFDDTEKAGMIAAVDAFDAAFRSGDYDTVFGYMPPKILAAIAASAGVDEHALREAMSAQVAAAMAMVTVDSYSMDTDAATYATTPDGSRDYALIPTETVMTVEGAGGLRATSETLAFQDGGAWYLVRIDEPQQVSILKSVYPEFAGVDFPPGTMVPLE